jgi:predicted membrane-bound spermidine synthase
MFALGMVSPQVIRLAVPDLAHVGRVAGRVYAWSTGGAIVGTFAAGYVLLSTAGADRTLLGVSLLLTLTSLLVAKVWDNNTMLYVFSIVLGGVTGGFILTWRGEYDPRVIAKLETNYYTIKVTEERDVYDRPTGVRILYLDALIHSEVNPNDPSYLHYIHEHIQVEFLWAAAAQRMDARVLVIGGGGYTFQRYAMEKVPQTLMDVVEIDPGVTKVAFEYLGLKHYPRLNIVHMDGRQYVAEKAIPETYDLVV